MNRTIWMYRVNLLILFCLAVLCWSLSGNAYGALKKQPAATTFQNVSGGLLARDYESMLRSEAQAAEPLPFTLWTQTDNQQVEGVGTGRTQSLSWVSVKGDTRLILPVMQTLDADDTNGCLIDRATAEKLFGNRNAVGSTVKMMGREYIVRGVIDGPSRTMVTGLARESDHVLNHVTVSGSDNTEVFLMRHGLTAAMTTKSSAYVFFARILYLLPVLAVIVVGLLMLRLLRWQWKSYHVRCLLVSVGMLGVGTAGLLLLFTCIPDGLIPSQWSDFEFWGSTGKDFFYTASDVLFSAKLRSDLSWIYGALQAAFGILSAHFVMCGYILFRIHHSGQPVLFVEVAGTESEQPSMGRPDYARRIDTCWGNGNTLVKQTKRIYTNHG